jgi:hypothetical protein
MSGLRGGAAAVAAMSCNASVDAMRPAYVRGALAFNSLRPIATTGEGSKAASRWHIRKPIDGRLSRPAVASP